MTKPHCARQTTRFNDTIPVDAFSICRSSTCTLSSEKHDATRYNANNTTSRVIVWKIKLQAFVVRNSRQTFACARSPSTLDASVETSCFVFCSFSVRRVRESPAIGAIVFVSYTPNVNNCRHDTDYSSDALSYRRGARRSYSSTRRDRRNPSAFEDRGDGFVDVPSRLRTRRAGKPQTGGGRSRRPTTALITKRFRPSRRRII